MISKVGGVIAAASKTAAFPLRQVGAISAIKRIVLTFQQAGVFPIAVVTGAEEGEVRYQLSASGVVFLPIEQNEAPQLFESVKVGLAFLHGKCEKIVFTPVNVPMFSPSTLAALLGAEGDIVTPSCRNRGGHPVVMAAEAVPAILSYSGEGGLRSAIASMERRRKRVAVEDEGILYTIHDPELPESRLEQHNREILHPVVSLSLERESPFFNARAKLLLLLIADNRSVRSACKQMALSYSKAWDMLGKLEQALGYPVVQRRHGGSRGGRTELTPQGYAFLKAYQQMEENVFRYTQEQFDGLFRQASLL